MPASAVGQSGLESTVNAFLLGMGVGTLLAIIVKPRQELALKPVARDKVDLASEDSFPASDAPGY
jgi:hypothetical protein